MCQLGVGDFVNRSVPTRMSLPLNDSNFYLQAICGPLVSYLLVIDEKGRSHSHNYHHLSLTY
jgi:hypothetical protein